MIKALIGDLFKSELQTLVNTVNCVGVMGKGIAEIFKKRYPAMFEDYAERCERGMVKLGEPYHYSDLAGVSIVNFPTKGHWRAATRLADVEAGLEYFVAHYKAWGIGSVAFPPLGCGNGGLEWEDVGPLMYSKLKPLGIPVEIYAPYGTSAKMLSEEFLGADQQTEMFDVKGRRPEKLRPQWAALVEVLRELGEQPYSYPIGRVTFQKVCFILTGQGLETGFRFKRGSYGPFSDDVAEAVSVLANKNWIQEKQLGPMTAVQVGPAFERDRVKYRDTIKKEEKRIHKTVDLFSRIRNTEQAEQVATIIFAVQALKRETDPGKVSEQELYDEVLRWKKKWGETEEKKTEVANTIRNLEMLGWVKLQFSESLPAAI